MSLSPNILIKKNLEEKRYVNNFIFQILIVMGHYQKFLRGQCFKKSSIFLLYFEHSKNSSKIFQQIMNSYFLMLYFAFVLGDNAIQKIVCKYRTGGNVFDFLVNCRDVLAISLKKNLCLTGICIAIRYVTCKGLHHSLPLSLLI